MAEWQCVSLFESCVLTFCRQWHFKVVNLQTHDITYNIRALFESCVLVFCRQWHLKVVNLQTHDITYNIHALFEAY